MEMRVTRRIERPAEEVFTFFADASNNPKWQAGMQSCEWTTDKPIAIGSTYVQVAKFMGRQVRSVFEVTALEAGRSISIETIESTFPIQVRRSVAPAGAEACDVSAVITGGPSGFVASVLDPITSRAAQRSVEKDYDRLVALLEP